MLSPTPNLFHSSSTPLSPTEMFHLGEAVVSQISDIIHGTQGQTKIEGTVVLVKRNVLDFNDFSASIMDRVSEVIGWGVNFKLISATVGDESKGGRGVVGPESRLENWITTLSPLTPGDSVYNMTFYWDPKQGIPSAFYVENHHPFEFYLKTVTLRNVPNKGSVHFDCYSWVYNSSSYKYTRVFFANNTYVTRKIPLPLQGYVDDELRNLRGEDVTREFKEGDRYYAYALYNDVGYDRPVLGGSQDLPYPRRGKTRRAKYLKDQRYETRMLLANIRMDIYVPRDERFSHLKMSDFLMYAIKSLQQAIIPAVKSALDKTPLEFDSLKDVLKLYEGGVMLPHVPALMDLIPFEMLKELARSDGERLLKFPMPQIIANDRDAWKSDEEFAREMLAGVNPIIIRRLQQFPPVSSLDASEHGNQTSTITAFHIEHQLDGVPVDVALNTNRLYILDHHDNVMPFLVEINSDSGNKIYAGRVLLFLKNDGTLKPIAIELSLPSSSGAESKVYTPAVEGVEHQIWQLAKAYAIVNDCGHHALISHWLHTHAVVEPFILATNRQLCAMHPINKLLKPHFRDTMTINALARQMLISSGGLVEATVFPGKFALEMSSVVYKKWNFINQAPPNDLITRGMAVKDESAPRNIRLLIEDYPYAVDGLDIWFCIYDWVTDYCSIYYPTDASVKEDVQVQAWWKEAVEVGHGDKKDEPWWPKMSTVEDLVFSCSTIIWIGSALHAAVNFGQYAYGGYLPNRPTVTRKFMPEPGSKDYERLKTDPEKVFLETINSQLQNIVGISLLEALSRHTSDEVYLGQRESQEWTSDENAIQAFGRFGENLKVVENNILERNQNPSLKNRNGPVQTPYTLLYPSTSDPEAATGHTGRGIPKASPSELMLFSFQFGLHLVPNTSPASVFLPPSAMCWSASCHRNNKRKLYFVRSQTVEGKKKSN